MKKRLKLPALKILRRDFCYDSDTGILTHRHCGRGYWADSVVGCLNNYGYRITSVEYQKCLVHRIIWKMVTGKDPKCEIDHVDNDRENNRWKNLREATESQNLHNMKRPAHNTSGYKGAIWEQSRNKWKAQIQVKSRTVFIGRFDSPQKANAAYLAAAKKYYGEFAHAG